jgi:PAS domain-containing protein
LIPFPMRQTAPRWVFNRMRFCDSAGCINGFSAMDSSETELRNMIDTIPALVWCCFPDGTTEFSDRRWLEYMGLSQGKTLGQGWQHATHPDNLERISSEAALLLRACLQSC